MPGRKPKPTGLKKVLGNPGCRPLNENEPKPTGTPVKPRFLKGRAARIWAEYARSLMALGVLTNVDSHMFAAWCALAAEFESSPERMTAARIAQLRALASSFGLDASARSRMSVHGGEKTQDEAAEKYFQASGRGPDPKILQ